MRLALRHGLLYVAVSLTFRNRELQLPDVIVDTGSAGTIFSADALLQIDLLPEPLDTLRRIRGIGGIEFVFSKEIQRLQAGNLVIRDFEVEVGALDYGFPVQGILGVDFLIEAGAIIDLKQLELRSTP